MFRSNVLILRRALSAAAYCGQALRWYSSATEPVKGLTNNEFLDEWNSVYSRRTKGQNGPVGLACSGGVDSMALATLYARAIREKDVSPMCHGFIIDHKARPESAEEAQWVAEQLRLKFDMDSTIIPIVWPKDIDPNNTLKFESAARALRYRALGLECKKKGITTLMTAHHGNDQAETVFMRLINERWRTGLQGMQSVQWIPECYGEYGVYHSGGNTTSAIRKQKAQGLPFPLERGGIQVIRPLLGFGKERLIATCEENGTPWVEDKTNHDPSLTTRNAIRHIIRQNKLPAALAPPALVSLANRMQDRISTLKQRAENIFDITPLKLDIQTGSLIVRLPSASSLLDRPIVTASDKAEARNVAYVLLERIVQMVSPHEEVIVGRFARAVDYIYPLLADEISLSGMLAFSMHSVWFRPYNNPSPFHSFPVRNEQEWILSRQPLEKWRYEQWPRFVVPPIATDPTPADKWQLFDGRFWIRVKNNTDHEVTVRPFVDTDLPYLNELSRTEGPYYGRFVRAALNLVKHADVRTGLPVIVRQDGGQERLIALPSLNAAVDNTEAVTWDLRYKKVDFGKQRVEDVVAKGVRKHDMLLEAEREYFRSRGMKRLRLTRDNAERKIKHTKTRADRNEQQGPWR